MVYDRRLPLRRVVRPCWYVGDCHALMRMVLVMVVGRWWGMVARLICIHTTQGKAVGARLFLRRHRRFGRLHHVMCFVRLMMTWLAMGVMGASTLLFGRPCRSSGLSLNGFSIHCHENLMMLG